MAIESWSGGIAGATAPPAYGLRCTACGAVHDDDGYVLSCTSCQEPSLLVTEHARRTFEPDETTDGLFRYWRWLPSRRVLPGVGGTITYQSDELSRATGLANLWIAFNGHWPERGATLETGTFKELEAWTVLARIPDGDDTVLVVASAGNTAAAFARTCSLYDVPCLIIVPEGALEGLQFADPLSPSVKIVTLGGHSDYYDAIQLAERVSRHEGFVFEGGVRNVGRRDGLGTVLLNAVEAIGRLPDYYFQAVGSGAGGIGVYEAANRLLADGRFGLSPPRLILSQNEPFTPMYQSWKAGGRDLVAMDEETAKGQVRRLVAQVLSNRKPAYATRGGVYDALTATDGDFMTADNEATLRASATFEDAEGIDPDPAGAVAFATLIKAVEEGRVARDATVLLNITGGGRRRLMATTRLVPSSASLQLTAEERTLEETPARVAALFDR